MTTSAQSEVLALTPGEPAGIGPDIAVMLAQHDRSFDVIVIADTRLLNDRAERLGLALTLHNVCDQPSSSTIARTAGHLSVHHIDLPQPCTIGQLDTRNAAYVIQTLNQAVDGCMSGEYGAMVTAPVHKGVINDAGVAFSGHTELIAERTASYPVMMLTAGSFRVALATTHLPLAKVAEAITKDTLLKVIRILHDDLKAKFAIANPRILVCGLNPHAGEGGHLGHEEIDIIEPVLNTLRAEGINLSGPLPADTLFTPKHLSNADAVLAMFHDQGLPVLKYAGFGESVNLTLGLPIIRTSVDHGTALDLAGSGQIDTGSMSAALSLAHELVQKTARQQS